MNGGLSDVIMRVSGLCKRYKDLVAVNDLSFEVQRGEILGFLGPNGAGKTTTLKMLCGLLVPDAGHIDINGERMRPSSTQCKKHIGLSPQEVMVWDTLTCIEQLQFLGSMYGVDSKTTKRKAHELLEVFGLQDKTHRLARTLSGGMRRRLNIALAMVHSPQLLFLDEPQAGLDPQSRVLVRDYIRELAGSMTVVVTTHDMEEAEKIAHRVCIIDYGQLLALDTVTQIKRLVSQDDLLEVEIAESIEDALLPSIPSLQGRDSDYYVVGNTLCVSSVDRSNLLAEIFSAIAESNLTLLNLQLRKTTLEDAFIRLTGRGLRE
jgi:ABC-2 type transport system ATP-binding protein